MTALSSYSDAWKQWMSVADPAGWVCDAIRFIFTDGTTVAAANKTVTRPTMGLTHENGVLVTYTEIGFTVAVPAKQLNTEYSLNITIRPRSNAIFNSLVFLSSGALLQPVRVEHRVYLLPTHPEVPALQPAGRFWLSQVSVSQQALVLSCLPPTLAKKNAGIPYTLESFSGLSTF